MGPLRNFASAFASFAVCCWFYRKGREEGRKGPQRETHQHIVEVQVETDLSARAFI